LTLILTVAGAAEVSRTKEQKEIKNIRDAAVIISNEDGWIDVMLMRGEEVNEVCPDQQ